MTKNFEDELKAAAAKAATPRARSQEGRGRAADETDRLERPDFDHWAPPEMLTTPPPDGTYVYRWIAEYVNGQFAANSLSSARRERYEFVRVDDLPEDFIVDEDTKGDGLARVGGLILARLPVKFAEQRKAYYAKRSAEGLHAADERFGLVAGRDGVREDRGTRSLEGRAAGDALRSMARGA